ncbi:MAG: hypothetical protein V1839_00425 [archaeon]
MIRRYGNRAVVDMLVEFALSVVIIMIIWLGIKVAYALGFGGASVGSSAIIESAETSYACDYWLMDFLRAKSPEGYSYADLLSLASESPKYKALFEKDAEAYFTKNYRRGMPLERWQLSAEDAAFIPITSVGFAEKQLQQRCSQKTAAPKGPLKVTLGVDY